MITRILPTEEWGRLQGNALSMLLPYVRQEDVQVLVVEDEGKIIATWAVMRITHLEGLWCDPAYRGNAGVTRRLIGLANQVAAPTSQGWVMTGSDTDHVAALLRRVGGKKIPMDTWVMPLVNPSLNDLVIGRAFHDQLFTLLPASHHQDNDEHDAHVGAAIRVGVLCDDPEKAEAAYNEWASTHGYAEMKWMGKREDGAFVADIVEAVIAVHPSLRVELIESRI